MVVVMVAVVQVVVVVVGLEKKMNPCPCLDVHHAYCQ
jgi:hypothetical protein